MSRQKNKWKEGKKLQNKFVGQTGVYKELMSKENASFSETPKNQKKLSECIIELVAPYSKNYPDRLDRIFPIGILAWNSAILPDTDEYDGLGEMKYSLGLSEESFAVMRIFFADLMKRKMLLFPNDKRFVVDHELIQNGPNFTLNVASTILDIE